MKGTKDKPDPLLVSYLQGLEFLRAKTPADEHLVIDETDIKAVRAESARLLRIAGLASS